jgi:exodeoxyribonuclease V
MTDLTQQQARAAEEAEAFLRHPNGRRYHVIHGLAGTGKTTTLGELALRLPSASVVTPTGKAAAVLREKFGIGVRTIHSAIYDFTGMVEDERTGDLRPTFVDKEDAGLAGKTVLLDECSMVGSKLAGDLLETGATVLAVGDPGQLPPVNDWQFFSSPNRTLTEIHRQALDSPIIRQAHAVRRGEGYRADGEDFRVVRAYDEVDLAAFDVVLCWRNVTRRNLNFRIRKQRGRTGRTLFADEPVMCLRNDHRRQIFNGEIYALTADREPGKPLRLEGGHVIPEAAVEDFDSEADFLAAKADDEVAPFAPAYAVTAHKAQGSEWPSVLVVDEMPDAFDDKARWLYTAITRARRSATVVRLGG